MVNGRPLSLTESLKFVNLKSLSLTRKKVIGLDDLLSDFYKEKSKLIDKQNKKRKASKVYDSDDDEHGQEAAISKYVDQCQNQACVKSSHTLKFILHFSVPVRTFCVTYDCGMFTCFR